MLHLPRSGAGTRSSALARNCSHVLDQAYVIAHLHTQEEFTMKRLSATPNRRISYQPRLTAVAAALLLAGIGVAPLALPSAAYAAIVANPLCPTNTAFFDPGNGQNIVVPPGYKVSVFASNL